MNTSKSKLYSLYLNKDLRVYLIIIVFCLAISAVFGAYTPKLINELYGSYSNDEVFYRMIKILSFFFVGEYLIRVLYQMLINKYIEKLMTIVREECYRNWLLSYEAIEEGKSTKDKYPLGEVMARIMSDTEAVKELITSGSFTIFIDTVYIVSCLISFISLNTTSGIFLIIAEILACVVLLYGSKYMVNVFMDTRKAGAWVQRSLSNVTAGLKQIFYTPHFNYASKSSHASFDNFLKKQLKANVWDASYYSIAESLYPILLALLVFVFPFSNIVKIGVFAAIIDLIQRSISPIKSATGKVSNFQRSRTGFQRINQFNAELSAMPSSNLDQDIVKSDLKKLEVTIDHFKYPGSDFEIKDVHFEAGAGELIGIVGMSGSGKSTVLKILSAGILSKSAHIKIFEEGEKVWELNPDKFKNVLDYRQHISIVSQESHVFTGSLKFNITMGQEHANVSEFFESIKNKIPYLKNWGVELSDDIKPSELSLGQKQLISALRACYLNKAIVLFDEISSSMDAELEVALRMLVLLIQQKALTIIVAHRVETIIKADQILVMEDGRIIDRGTHDQLVSQSVVYQKFIDQIRSLS